MKKQGYFCLLIVLFSITDCKKKEEDSCGHVVCAIGATCINGTCSDLVTGNYHMTGSSQYWSLGDTTYHPPTIIDDTVAITRISDSTLHMYSYDLDFNLNGADTVNEYSFLWMPGSPSNFAQLVFKKAYNDSAYYNARSGGLGGGTTVSIKGRKIH